MEQRLMGLDLPPEVACGDVITDMGSEKSVLILMKHCRDMKQQEMRLRLITLLLLLLCTALYMFGICADLRQHKKSGSNGQGSAVSPGYSKQERVCPTATANPQMISQRMHIHLRSVSANRSDKVYIEWQAVFGEDAYNKEKSAIVIPETSIYFVYVRIALRCQGKDGAADFTGFHAVLHKWNEGYNKTVDLTQASDGVLCTSKESRNVFVGRLFELEKGDHVSVWIEEGYKLIRKASFGAYLA